MPLLHPSYISYLHQVLLTYNRETNEKKKKKIVNFDNTRRDQTGKKGKRNAVNIYKNK